MDCSNTHNHLDFSVWGFDGLTIHPFPYMPYSTTARWKDQAPFPPTSQRAQSGIATWWLWGNIRWLLGDGIGKFWGIDCLIDPNSSRSMLGCPVPPKSPPKDINQDLFPGMRQVWPWCRMAVHQHDTEAEGVPQLGPAGRDAGELWDSPMRTFYVVLG